MNVTLAKLFMRMVLGSDVTNAVEEAKQSPKTFIYKKRVMGPIIAGTATLASYGLGIEIDKEKVEVVIDSWNNIAQAGRQIYEIINVQMVPAIIAIWGVIMGIKGLWDAKIREMKSESTKIQ